MVIVPELPKAMFSLKSITILSPTTAVVELSTGAEFAPSRVGAVSSTAGAATATPPLAKPNSQTPSSPVFPTVVGNPIGESADWSPILIS